MKLHRLHFLLVVVLLSGCGFISQLNNEFQSFSMVGYIPPYTIDTHYYYESNCTIGKDCYRLTNPYVSFDSIDDKQTVINQGDIIVVDLVSGWLPYNFETAFENRMSSGYTRNEISITTRAYESRPTESNATGNKFEPPSYAQQTIIIKEGQLSKRYMGFQNITIYGPTSYDGGDLIIQVVASELDGDDLQFTSDTLQDQIASLDQNRTAALTSPLSENLGKYLGSFSLKSFGSTNIAAYGVEAAILGAKIYKEIHSKDDTLIDHPFTLVSSNRSKSLPNMWLREGIYPLIRIPTKASEQDWQNLLQKTYFDPYRDRLFVDAEQCEVMWLLFRVSKVKPVEKETPTKK